jgi:F0F1-type ATP synthase assembly protein I
MFGGAPNPKEMGYYFSLAQIGMEMVVPIGIGVALDRYLGCSPWGAILGTLLGFAGGLTHLIVLVNQHDKARQKKRPPGGES